MTKIISSFLPLFIAGVLQFGTNAPIVKKNEVDAVEIKKVKYLKIVYTVLNWFIAILMIAFDAMAENPDIDFFNLIRGKSTYDAVSLLSNIDQPQNRYFGIFVFLICVAVIISALFFIAGHKENSAKRKTTATPSSAGKRLVLDLLHRIMMFSFGAFVAGFSLIVLFETPVEIVVETPLVKYIEYLIVFMCLFINFRFQIKADQKHEINPDTLGCISICGSAVWCTFIYSLFSISFLFSFSTFIHINDFVIQEQIYSYMTTDYRICLLFSSMSYAFLFIITSKGRFRKKHWYVFAFYILSAGLLFFAPMLSALTGERVLTVLIFILLFCFFYFCYRKIMKQAKAVDKESASSVNERPDPWTITTLGISAIIVLVAYVYPFVEPF